MFAINPEVMPRPSLCACEYTSSNFRVIVHCLHALVVPSVCWRSGDCIRSRDGRQNVQCVCMHIFVSIVLIKHEVWTHTCPCRFVPSDGPSGARPVFSFYGQHGLAQQKFCLCPNPHEMNGASKNALGSGFLLVY